MATVTHPFDVHSGMFRTTAFPALVQANGSSYPVAGLAFDATVDESVFFTFTATNYASGNLTLTILWYADTATASDVVWESQIGVITPNTDTQDVETDGLATLNFVMDTHLGTTGQRVHQTAITISNLDSLAADDRVVLRVARDADSTSDTDDMAGDAILISPLLLSYSDT